MQVLASSCTTGSSADKPSRLPYYLETAAILAVTFGVALTGVDLSVILSLVGAIGSTSRCHILPGLFYLKFTWRDHAHWSATQVGAVVLIAVGIFIMPTAVVFTFYTVEPEDGASSCQVLWPGSVG